VHRRFNRRGKKRDQASIVVARTWGGESAKRGKGNFDEGITAERTLKDRGARAGKKYEGHRGKKLDRVLPMQQKKKKNVCRSNDERQKKREEGG